MTQCPTKSAFINTQVLINYVFIVITSFDPRVLTQTPFVRPRVMLGYGMLPVNGDDIKSFTAMSKLGLLHSERQLTAAVVLQCRVD